jgi:hypothetical protein
MRGTCLFSFDYFRLGMLLFWNIGNNRYSPLWMASCVLLTLRGGAIVYGVVSQDTNDFFVQPL